MDFFGYQEHARRCTRWLVVLYAVAVSAIIAAVYLVIAVMLNLDNGNATTAAAPPTSLWMPEVFLTVALAVTAVVLTGSFFKTMQLRQGGSVVARSLGGRAVAPDTRDADERRLLNVVEEMALASGTSVPQVYLLDDEDGINAFAAGYSPRDAVIGVTRGCMEKLSRDELQGVIAHEFSHIVNGDMRLNIRLMGILFGILMLTLIGQVLLRTAYLSGGRSHSRRSNDKRGGNPLPFLGLALIIIGYIGVFFANLIKSAISRQREFLCDAAAVQYTRNPAGIAGALQKIGGLSSGARIRNAHAVEASHLFFGSTLKFAFFGLFATHPPLATRIRRLDPAFNAELKTMLHNTATTAGVAGFSGGAGEVNLAAATAMLRELPVALLADAHDSVAARTLVYALLWSEDAQVQKVQQQALELDPQSRAGLPAMRARLAEVKPEMHLPLAELVVPTLRMLDKTQYERFRSVVTALTEADQEVDLFEFALSQMILRHVEPGFGRVSTAPIRYRKLEQILPASAVVLASLAVWGTRDRAAAQACYDVGMAKLSPLSPPPLDPQHATLEQVVSALDELAKAAPALKKKILEACHSCIVADANIAVEQAELFRAIADAIDVPMPPLHTC